MKVNTKSEREINQSTNNTGNYNNNQMQKKNIIISENYQAFLSLIYLIIGCSFLFYLFSFVFSIYVSLYLITLFLNSIIFVHF